MVLIIVDEYDLDEHELYLKYPQHHKWWNKLYLAETMGYSCGPGGVRIPSTGEYVIRPIYNLIGMGVCTTIKVLKQGDCTSTPPGYFWCEYLEGNHYSATYENINGTWKPLHCWQGWNRKSNVVKFNKWIRSDYTPTIPKAIANINNVKYINIEYKGDNPIELHFRPSGNPDGTSISKWNEYIPIWHDTTQFEKDKLVDQGYTWIDNPYDDWMEDMEPYLNERRLGYYVR